MFRFVSNIFSRLNFGGILSHQRGFTLIEIVTTLAVLSAVTLTSGSVVMMSGKIQNSAMSRVQIDLFQRELIRHIQSDNSWERTLMGELNAHALDCLYHETACEVQGRAIENQRFAVYEPGGQLFYDGSSDNSGLTEKGEKCSAFSQEGNDSCPYQFRVMWSAVCQPGNCVKPQIKITTTFHYSPKNLKQNINPGAYSTTFFKDEGPEPASLDCEGHANGSTWSQFVDRVDPRACAPSGSTFDTYRTTTNFVCTNAVIYSSNSDALLSSGVCPAIPTNCGTYASGSTWTTFTDDSVSRPCPPSASTTDVYRTSTTFQCLAGVTTQVSQNQSILTSGDCPVDPPPPPDCGVHPNGSTWQTTSDNTQTRTCPYLTTTDTFRTTYNYRCNAGSADLLSSSTNLLTPGICTDPPPPVTCGTHANGATWSDPPVNENRPRNCTVGTTTDVFRVTQNYFCNAGTVEPSKTEVLLTAGICTNCDTHLDGDTWSDPPVNENRTRTCAVGTTTDVYTVTKNYSCTSGAVGTSSQEVLLTSGKCDCAGHADGTTWQTSVNDDVSRLCPVPPATIDTFRTVTDHICEDGTARATGSNRALLTAGTCSGVPPLTCGIHPDGSTWSDPEYTENRPRTCPGSGTPDVYGITKNYVCNAGVTVENTVERLITAGICHGCGTHLDGETWTNPAVSITKVRDCPIGTTNDTYSSVTQNTCNGVTTVSTTTETLVTPGVCNCGVHAEGSTWQDTPVNENRTRVCDPATYGFEATDVYSILNSYACTAGNIVKTTQETLVSSDQCPILDFCQVDAKKAAVQATMSGGVANAGPLVDYTYCLFYGRNPDIVGRGYWRHTISQAAGISVDAFVQNLRQSAEGQRMFSSYASDRDFIKYLYDDVLARVQKGLPTTQGEIDWWANELAQPGATRDNVFQSFIISAEFQTDLTKAKNDMQVVTPAASWIVVDMLYKRIFKRTPAQNEIDEGYGYWLSAVQKGVNPPGFYSTQSMASSFVAQTEFRNLFMSQPPQMTAEKSVELAYAYFLRRPSDQAGRDYWIADFKGRAGDKMWYSQNDFINNLAPSFVISTEFMTNNPWYNAQPARNDYQ